MSAKSGCNRALVPPCKTCFTGMSVEYCELSDNLVKLSAQVPGFTSNSRIAYQFLNESSLAHPKLEKSPSRDVTACGVYYMYTPVVLYFELY